MLLGGSGNDQLYGGHGGDNLYGGTGTDRLEGDQGDDVYHWGRGDGNDTIYDFDSSDRNASAHQDKLLFGAGIELSDISWIRTGNDLRLTIAGEGGGRVTIDNHFVGSDYRVEVIELADGTVLDQAQIAIDVHTQTGTDSSETLSGFETDDTLIGEGG